MKNLSPVKPEASNAFTKADIREWCSLERVEKFKSEFLPIIDLIACGSSFSDNLIEGWIIKEILYSDSSSEKFLSFQSSINPDDQLKLDNTWKSRNKTIFSLILQPEDISHYASANSLLLKWAQNNWNNRLESLYLERKNLLDRVSCSLLRVKNKYLALELYQRLKSNESSFEEVSWKDGEGVERKHAGYFTMRRLNELPSGLLSLIKKIKVGEVLKPHAMGKWNVIIKLHEIKSSQFDEETKNYILRAEINEWLRAIASELAISLQ